MRRGQDNARQIMCWEFCSPICMTEQIRELTEKRAMGSVPFGGRYRLIDFPLSNMVNSGINKVGVITQEQLPVPDGSPRLRQGVGSLPQARGPVHPAARSATRAGILNNRLESLRVHPPLPGRIPREEYVVLSRLRHDLQYGLQRGAGLPSREARRTSRWSTASARSPPKLAATPPFTRLTPDGRVLDMLVNPPTWKATATTG